MMVMMTMTIMVNMKMIRTTKTMMMMMMMMMMTTTLYSKAYYLLLEITLCKRFSIMR